jgi:hypothetical protein
VRRQRRLTEGPRSVSSITPHALALSADGKRLFVALSDTNAVAVLDIEDRGRTEILGFIPTGAYPSALGGLLDGRVLIGSGKGFGTGPNDKTAAIDSVAPTSIVRGETKSRYPISRGISRRSFLTRSG